MIPTERELVFIIIHHRLTEAFTLFPQSAKNGFSHLDKVYYEQKHKKSLCRI